MINLFALKLKTSDQLLGFSVSSNGDDAEFCNAVAVYLEEGCDSVWIATSMQGAEDVRSKSPPWYNSSLTNPSHEFKPEDLEVVCFQQVQY